jgi:hypothetical protein
LAQGLRTGDFGARRSSISVASLDPDPATRYLVIGAYATESWAHSSFGRKIEKGVDMRASGVPIAIVGESHWAEHLTP